jgi:hypothetical protein
MINGEFGADLAFVDSAKYVNKELIREYQKEIACVQIEDVVLVKADICENFSPDIPCTVEKIEKFMRGEAWK